MARATISWKESHIKVERIEYRPQKATPSIFKFECDFENEKIHAAKFGLHFKFDMFISFVCVIHAYHRFAFQNTGFA